MNIKGLVLVMVMAAVVLSLGETAIAAESLPNVPPLPAEFAKRIEAAKKNPVPTEFAEYKELFGTWWTGEWEAVNRMRAKIRKEESIIICESSGRFVIFRGVGDSRFGITGRVEGISFGNEKN